MVSMIAAVSENGVIGCGDKIPWMGKYPEDLKRFKNLTLNSTVIMGRKTFESMGNKKLPKRNNVIITNQNLLSIKYSVETNNSIENTIDSIDEDIWIIGGATLYQQSMNLVDKIDLTIVPEIVENNNNNIYFPWINPYKFSIYQKLETMSGDKKLIHVIYERKK